MSGLKIAVLYGIYPHKLGFCGPREEAAKKILSDFLSGKKIALRKIKKILRDFKAAYSYYKLIASANGIRDPFSERVVKAYWIGNKLLEKVSLKALKEMVIKDFSKPGLLPKELAVKKAEGIPRGAKPHHSFHVLVIGSVTGRVILNEKLKNLCRISWGKVIKIKESRIIIEYKPLIIKNKKLRLAKPIEREVVWDKNLIGNIKRGDWITVHWNQAIQALERKDISLLERYTRETINLLSLNG